MMTCPLEQSLLFYKRRGVYPGGRHGSGKLIIEGWFNGNQAVDVVKVLEQLGAIGILRHLQHGGNDLGFKIGVKILVNLNTVIGDGIRSKMA